MLLATERSASETLKIQRQFLLRELALVEQEIKQVERERSMLEEKITSLTCEWRRAA